MTNGGHLLIEGMILGGLVAGARAGHHLHPPRVHRPGAHPPGRDRALLPGRHPRGQHHGLGPRVRPARSSSVPGSTSAARRARCSRRSRASAPSRATSRRSPASSAADCGHGRPSSTTSRPSSSSPSILAKGVDWMKTSGHERLAGREVRRRQRRRREPRRLRSPDGDAVPRADRRARRRRRRPAATLKAYAPSGPPAATCPASMLDLPLDWNAMTAAGATVGSGAIVVCDDRALHARHGARTPCASSATSRAASACRAGPARPRWRRCSTEWTKGRRGAHDLALYDELCHAMKMTSICGLGQVVPVPIASVMKHFPDEVEAHAEGRLPGGRLLPHRSVRMSEMIALNIDGRDVSVPKGTTIFDAARMNGIAIPTLCHQQNQTPVGVCRVCVVDVGARVYRGLLHPRVRAEHEGHDRRAGRRPGADDAGRDADGGSSDAVRAPAAQRRLRARDDGEGGRAWRSRDSRGGCRRAGATTRR